LRIVDVGFAAATNNITITPASADKTNNGTAGASVVINTNGANKVLMPYTAMPGWITL
jgi:hypothetical protein